MITDYYYYNKLSDGNKIIYKKLYESIIQMDATCLLENTVLDSEEAHSIIDALDNDNPHLFYANLRHLQAANNGRDTEIRIEYYYPATEVKRYLGEVEACVNTYLKSVNMSMDDFEKVRILYEKMVLSVEYDFDASESDMEAFSALGALCNNKAKCEGISKAFKLLLNAADIKCLVVNGEAESPMRAGDDRHAWNIVKIGDTSFHVDVTWAIADDGKSDGVSFDYFGLNDEQIQKDHFGYCNTPECKSDMYDYFKLNNRSVINAENVEPLLKNSISVPCKLRFRLDYECDFEKESKRCSKIAKELVKNGDYKVRVNTGCREKQKIVVITTSKE